MKKIHESHWSYKLTFLLPLLLLFKFVVETMSATRTSDVRNLPGGIFLIGPMLGGLQFTSLSSSLLRVFVSRIGS